jgi:uncharacterized sulfatase
MILADDQSYTDFGFMGNPLVRTPHIDRLAEQSARYVNGYVPSSVCRPSLATLLTGLYPHEHGIHFNHPAPGNSRLNRMNSDEYYAARADAEQLFARNRSLPRILAHHGYNSLQTGKFWEGNYRNAGFTHGMTTGRAAGAPGCWDKTLPDGVTVAHGNGDVGLAIGRVTMEPIAGFLDDHAGEGRAPFLLWYAPVLPHEPHDAPQKYVDLYENNPHVPRHFVRYYANCTWFDDTVGTLMQLLEERGLMYNTLVVFVSDNGWTPSTVEHPTYPGFDVDKRSKRSPFERGLRTPILIRWDGQVKAATHEEPCSSVDVVPTILGTLGLKKEAANMSGIDLMPSAQVETPLDPKRPVFGEVYPGDASQLGDPSADVAYRWVRRGPWKLIVPHSIDGKPAWGGYLNRAALYNVVDDPDEQKNVISSPENASVADELQGLLDGWWRVSSLRGVMR